MNSEEEHLNRCRILIEQKLAWGNSGAWQNQDFEALSEKIFAATKVSLSSSTLKRLWGKVRYQSTPNLATLNTLAQFVGYENWRLFVASNQPEHSPAGPVVELGRPQVPLPAPAPARKWPMKLGGGAAGLAAVLWLVFAMPGPKPRTLMVGQVAFTSQLVAQGVPNTVVFQYSATDSNADSVFIQQSWDPKRRFWVAKDQREYTSTYYYPGYFRAKLILNDSVVREHDVLIETNGWLGTIDEEPIPHYLPKRRPGPMGEVAITQADLTSLQIRPDTLRWSSLFWVQKDQTVPSDNFVLAAEVRHTFGQAQGVCQHSKIVLLCTEGAHVIPLSIKGCVGELNLVLGNQAISGRTNDLSAFGVDFADWVRVRCEVRDRQVRIFLNERLAYRGSFPEAIGQVVGTRIRFAGTGAVRGVKLSRIGG
jgi:hypothetical protein